MIQNLESVDFNYDIYKISHTNDPLNQSSCEAMTLPSATFILKDPCTSTTRCIFLKTTTLIKTHLATVSVVVQSLKQGVVGLKEDLYVFFSLGMQCTNDSLAGSFTTFPQGRKQCCIGRQHRSNFFT